MKILRLSYYIVFVFVSLSSFANVDLNNSLSGRPLIIANPSSSLSSSSQPYIADLRLGQPCAENKFDTSSGNFIGGGSLYYNLGVGIGKIGSNNPSMILPAKFSCLLETLLLHTYYYYRRFLHTN